VGFSARSVPKGVAVGAENPPGARIAVEQASSFGSKRYAAARATVPGVPRAFANDDDQDLVQAERDVRAALGELPLDLRSLAAVSNIFRAATAVRNHMERTILAESDLSWSAFTVLFVLRVWGDMETRRLAAEAGITTGTLTGVLKTLEKKGLAGRTTNTADRRRVTVSATGDGRRAIDRIMPAFNEHERLVTRDLSARRRDELSDALRQVLRTVAALDRAPHA
jgi:MarR family transcriptional regulator, organic hydroperoxide resistance regulator